MEGGSLVSQQFDAKRVEILSTIEQISNSLEVNNEERGRQLWSHKRAYNEIMDRLYAMNEPRRFDPLDKFPVEIWQSILYKMVSSDARPPNSKLFYRFLPNDIFVSMLVSKRWLRSIVNTPFLWTTISLDTDYPDNLARVKVHLELSRELPLFIRVTIPFPGWIEAVPFLAENRHRIMILQITSRTLKYGNSTQAVSEIEAYLNDLLPLPILSRFDIFNMSLNPGTPPLVQKVLLECPSFIYIMNPDLPQEILELDSALQLRSFQTTQNLLGLVQNRFPNLLSIKFSSSHTQPSTESIAGNHSLSWSFLGFISPSKSPPPLTIVSRLSNLVTFESTVNGSILKELLCRLHMMARLSKLILRIDCEEQYRSQLPSDTDIQPCYRAIILDISLNSIPSPKLTIQDINIYFDRVQELVLRALPSIEELTLRSTHVVPAQFIDYRTFPRLSTLHLNTIPQLGVDMTISPSVKNLYFITSNHWLRGFPNLSSSSIQRLVMDSWLYSLIASNTGSQERFEPEKWSALTSLTISVHHVAEISTRFEYLRNLVLQIADNIYAPQSATSDLITRFCRNLAMNPSRLPVLESLSLGHLPEWDIFFIMLERRNITKIQGLSRLKKITLPSHYPKELLGPIHDLIRGRFATRPSNWDLSLAGNLELLEDITV
jgi:hypothetical protein